ncbi:MAG: DUF1592 domain-containing protein [Verrucomicrobiota bacterium]|nr:DUF1592 domain-containing protein [Verrucomicrobiota bacterium]
MILAAAAWLCLTNGVSAVEQPGLALIENYCFDCHDSDLQKGEVDLEAALGAKPLVKNMDLWRTVISRVESGDMPPKKKPQLKPEEKEWLLNWLDSEINHFDYSKVDNPGYEPVRRLTHIEFSNTLRDLLGLDLNLVADFPIDLSGTSVFENSANTLFLQPILMERYLSAVDKAVEAVVPLDSKPNADSPVFVAWPSGKITEREAARKIIGRFMLRAFRRPPTEDEAKELHGVYARSRKAGESFQMAIRRALGAALVSPAFLLKSEIAQDTDESYQVSDYELACRLSYYLWASMPDDELFQLAAEKRLAKPGVLAEQVTRMLADPKAGTLGSVFAAQWLGFDALGVRVRLDPIDNPWCTDTLMAAMKKESAMVFTALVRENRPLKDLIDSKNTFVNEELAKFYKLKGVEGMAMRRVSHTDKRRYGLFGQASVLAVTSSPHRTSPIRRGEWILNSLLGTPPPPPPPDVGELDEEIEENRKLSFRQKLEMHSKDPRCNSCHREMDPLGFSLENYDWFGRWRTKSRGRTIDARGKLPSGTEFEGPVGLREVILAEKLDDLARQVIRKMLSYGLGRQLEYYDEPAVRKILATFKKDGYRMQTLVREVVKSYPFQFRKNRVEPDNESK